MSSLSGASKAREGAIDDPTDADYAAAARAALGRKDLRHALEQATAAVTMQPLHKPHLRLLDEVLARTRAPLEVLKLPDEGAFFGTCAVRGRALAKAGRTDEALVHVARAVAFRPATPFLPWAVSWVAAAKSARRVVPATLAASLLDVVAAARREAPWQESAPAIVANLDAALTVIEKVQSWSPPSVDLLVAKARVLRALGRTSDAIAAIEAWAQPTSWQVAVERAAVHAERGEREERLAWLERARAARPDDLATHLDLGDAHLDEGRLAEAMELYGLAAALDPASTWAKASLAYARALAEGASSLSVEDARGNASEAENARRRSLAADLSSYTTRISDPCDPIVGVLRSLQSRVAGGVSRLNARVRGEGPLAPSAALAFRHILAGRDGELTVAHEGPARADSVLWKASGEARLAPPGAEVVNRVRAVAEGAFTWAAWCDRAREAPADSADALMAAMANAPAPPAPDYDVVHGVHAFQIAAALRLAFGREPQGDRVAHLFALLEDRGDWTSAAAVLGLRALGTLHRERSAELISRLEPWVPSDDGPLPPYARALAITATELTVLTAGPPNPLFLRLRARVRSAMEPLRSS